VSLRAARCARGCRSPSPLVSLSRGLVAQVSVGKRLSRDPEWASAADAALPGTPGSSRYSRDKSRES
jgi:hypothetical protein